MRSCGRSVVVLALALLACTPRSGDDGPPTKAVADGGAGAGAGAGVLADPSYAVMQKVCASPCTGNFATVQVYRGADGNVGRLRYEGDLDSCSHPPHIYFDAQGNQTLAVAERPVAAGSAEAEALAAERAVQLEGLTEAERLSCFDPAHCEARRTEGFVSDYACRSDSDCVTCDCRPVDRPELERRGGSDACNEPGRECMATNPACCDGKCVLAR